MFTRRQALGLFAAPLFAKDRRYEDFGEVIYESQHPGTEVTIIGHLHHTDRLLDDWKMEFILQSQKETYELLDIMYSRGIRKLLVEGVERGQPAQMDIEHCDVAAYNVNEVGERQLASGCLDAGRQYVLTHQDMQVSGWDDIEKNKIEGLMLKLSEPDESLSLEEIQTGYAMLGATSKLSWQQMQPACEYMSKRRSANLLLHAMQKNPCVATVGMRHLDHIVPWIVNSKIAIKQVDGSDFGIDMPAFEQTFAKEDYHFTLLKTNARHEHGNYKFRQS